MTYLVEFDVEYVSWMSKPFIMYVRSLLHIVLMFLCKLHILLTFLCKLTKMVNSRHAAKQLGKGLLTRLWLYLTRRTLPNLGRDPSTKLWISNVL